MFHMCCARVCLPAALCWAAGPGEELRSCLFAYLCAHFFGLPAGMRHSSTPSVAGWRVPLHPTCCMRLPVMCTFMYCLTCAPARVACRVSAHPRTLGDKHHIMLLTTYRHVCTGPAANAAPGPQVDGALPSPRLVCVHDAPCDLASTSSSCQSHHCRGTC
jgi:hypothetical protein